MSETSTPTEIAVPTTADLWTDFDRLFDELHGQFFGGLGFGYAPLARPTFRALNGERLARTDVRDTGSAYQLSIEVPGIAKDALTITVKGANVEIRGAQTTKQESKESGVLHRERSYSGFYRAIELPEPVVGAQAKAKVEHGVLELELPKEHPTPAPAEVTVPVQ